MERLDTGGVFDGAIRGTVDRGVRDRGRVDRIYSALQNCEFAEGQSLNEHLGLVLDLLAGAGVHTPGWVRLEATVRREAAAKSSKSKKAKKQRATS